MAILFSLSHPVQTITFYHWNLPNWKHLSISLPFSISCALFLFSWLYNFTPFSLLYFTFSWNIIGKKGCKIIYLIIWTERFSFDVQEAKDDNNNILILSFVLVKSTILCFFLFMSTYLVCRITYFWSLQFFSTDLMSRRCATDRCSQIVHMRHEWAPTATVISFRS